MLHVEVKGDKYVLTMDGYSATLVQFCKKLQSARYAPATKAWIVARNLPNACDLEAHGHFKDEEMLKLRDGALVPEAGTVTPVALQLLPHVNLYAHQTDFMNRARRVPRGMLRADPGLGKTLMAMMWWQIHGVAPEWVVIVCPASLKGNWAKELKDFMGLDAIVVEGSAPTKKKLIAKKGLHIINYESFTRLYKEFDSKCALVVDESHFAKNSSSDRSKVLHAFGKSMEFVLTMTGTPVSQGPHDFYSQFKITNPELLGSSFTAFKHRYCLEEPVRGAPMGVTRIVGHKNIEELMRFISPYYVSYSKAECLDLPPKTYQTRYVQLSVEQRTAYQTLKRELALELEGGEDIIASNILTRLIRFSQIVQGFLPTGEEGRFHRFKSNPKLEELENVIAELEGSFIVMCRFIDDIKQVSDLLTRLGIKHGIIDGSVPAEDRLAAVADVQEGRTRALVGQTRAAGVGFTMTAASTLIFYSNTYSLVDREQAEDRIHRIGTKGTCLYIDIVAGDTVDEDVVEALLKKKSVAEMVLSIKNRVQD